MTYVIKIGGAVVDSPLLLNDVLDRCAALDSPFILVHGGGKVATKLAADLGIEQTMIDGRRVTDAETLRVVTMAYAGLVNKNVVAQLQARGVQCIGMTGADADLVRAHKRNHPTIDFGFVGDVDAVNTDVLELMLANGISVVVAPLTHDGNGSLLNTNADTMAARIANAMDARTMIRLRFIYEHHGVLRNINDPTSVIDVIASSDVDGLIADGVISKGMVPKITNAVEAAKAGINVRIQHTSALGTEEGTLVQ
ncbi:MAG: acetylglutamate kinase [Ignavibacteria bacterium]|nr:acetylglutamate kinase [Ignavibacteria bacterium]MBK7577191.1 acetylglutamate kinase [Ignavibacteria bacterium]